MPKIEDTNNSGAKYYTLIKQKETKLNLQLSGLGVIFMGDVHMIHLM